LRAAFVIEYAIEEARNLNHNYVGTEHLLLGLLRLVGLQLGGGGSGRAAVAGGEGEQAGEKQGIAHGDLRKWAKANPSAPGVGIQQPGAPTAQP